MLKLLQLLATDKQNFLTLSDHRPVRIRLSQRVTEVWGKRKRLGGGDQILPEAWLKSGRET